MIKSISSVKIAGRRVVLRAGFDVPLEKSPHTEEMHVADENRIKASLPTIKLLIDQKARIVIMSHLGRPEGKWDKSKSLWPVAEILAKFLSYKVEKIKNKLSDYSVPTIHFLTEDITKKDFSGLSKKLKEGDILFLENMRFYADEEENDFSFVETLASFGDVYVNDAFSVAHRKEASTYGIAQKLPSYAGLGLSKELLSLSKIIKNPQMPMVVVMGGAKISDKIDTIRNLAKHADHILIGGALANSFLSARGYEIGKSKSSDLSVAKELLRNFKDKIVLPVDVVVGKDANDDRLRSVSPDKVRSNDIIYDIGPETIRKFAGIIKAAKTLVWNGPMGMIESPRFAFGSMSIARIFGARAKGPSYGVVGGGETVEVVDMAHVAEYIDHISTGGGAMLEFLAGKNLPAIKVLDK